ncbi:MAG: hypothetical protein QM779_09790 [Propionicimonas sp.]|uniref:hypothetical protein n=1 Tax=Propionicimonas sp. TaxID=1955623 RepID=UPI003D132208
MPFGATTLSLFTLATLVLVPLVGAATMFWPASVARRERRVRTWAEKHLAVLTPDVATAVDTALARRRRLDGVLLLLLSLVALPVAFVQAGDGVVRAVVMTLCVSLGVVAALTASWQLSRPWFEVGPTRSARPRAVSLRDYVFPPVRWCAWASGAVCLAGIVLVLLAGAPPAVTAVGTAPSIGVVASVLASEWNGRRAARRPQPARDAAELYALDAWRADVAGTAFQAPAWFGGYVTIVVTWRFVPDPVASALLQVAGVLLLVLWIATKRIRAYGMTWTRHRLWPTLADGDTITVEAATA